MKYVYICIDILPITFLILLKISGVALLLQHAYDGLTNLSDKILTPYVNKHLKKS